MRRTGLPSIPPNAPRPRPPRRRPRLVTTAARVSLGLICAGLCASACEEKRPSVCPRYVQQRHLSTTAENPPVAKVNGHPIPAAAVARRAREAGLSPREALEQLIDEELLVQEAERLGIHREPDVVIEGKQAAIYAYLRQGFEQDYTREDIPEAKLREFYRANSRKKFQRPELRRFAHLFVKRPLMRRGRQLILHGPKDRALRKKMEALRQVVREENPQTTLAFNLLSRSPAGKAAGVSAESGLGARDNFRKRFAKVLFALPEPGAISDVFATKSWYHIVYLIEIVPGTDVSFAQARPEIIERLWPHLRKQAFHERLEQLRDKCRVVTRPEHLPVSPLSAGDAPGVGAPPTTERAPARQPREAMGNRVRPREATGNRVRPRETTGNRARPRPEPQPR